ncbi:SpoIIE family protein phosphatase [Alcaligenaceae bacterium CGII-47]|nr:SpoIIE family protein phosphatase [Alcaligenaceae bacterium CGII-47]
MRLTTLRSKIFLLVGLSLLFSAVAVTFVTQRDVTHTVVDSEQRAVRNVLQLLIHDSEARWGGLLSNKITTVRNDRAQLVQLGTTVRTVLDGYVTQVAHGTLTPQAAQGLAQQWLNGLAISTDRYSFAFDSEFMVLASGQPSMRGMNITSLRDIKGHELAASAYRTAQNEGHGFAIYRWPSAERSAPTELRYAYFEYFEPWDWVFVITDSAHEVLEQFDQRRQQMEQSISQALASVRLAQSGFAFIMADDARLVSPLPHEARDLLDIPDTHSGKTLGDTLAEAPRTEQIRTIQFEPLDKDTQWEISSAHFKPLGWTIVAAVPTEDLTEPATDLVSGLIWLFLGILVITLGLAWALAARITHPLQQLSHFAKALPEQDLSTAGPIPDTILQLPEKQPDEVGRLASTFISMDRQLREKVASLMQEATARERFQSELNIAREIQMGLLPIPLPAYLSKQVDLYATMIPAKDVGGDLYDYFLLPDGRLCIAIGDVSGKGIPAALFMAVTCTLIRACAEDETNPAILMERVNNRLAENNPNMMFVTLVIGVLDLSSGAFNWANGGHPAPCVVLPDGQLKRLEGRSGPACGIQEDLSYLSFDTTLNPTEILLGYTDGITEAFGPDGDLYDDHRLFSCIAIAQCASARQLTDTLLQDVRDFAQDTEQSDDITLIAVKRAEL